MWERGRNGDHAISWKMPTAGNLRFLENPLVPREEAALAKTSLALKVCNLLTFIH